MGSDIDVDYEVIVMLKIVKKLGQGDVVLQFGIFWIVMMNIVKIFGPRGLGPQFGIFGIVMMKIVKIFGPRGRGRPMVARQALSAYLHLKGEPDLWSR